MKKIIIIITALIFVNFLFTSCQKAKESEGKKEVQPQQTQKQEIKQQLPTPPETKKEEKPSEKPAKAEPSPLTDADQKEFERLKKKWLTPKFTEEDALIALKILVKADLNAENVRWYSTREAKEWELTRDTCDTVGILSNSNKKEAFDELVKILEKHKNSILEVTCTIKSIQVFGDKTVIPILRPFLSYSYPKEKYASFEADYVKAIEGYERVLKLETAGSLLTLGDADTALPVLDELARNGATTALGYIFHSMEGKEWKDKGVEIIKKAYGYEVKENEKALETKVLAALFLIRLNEVDKESIEKFLIQNAEKIISKKQWPISSYGYSDHRTLETVIIALKELESKKSIPLLKRITEHPDASYLVRWANEAIEYLSKENGGTK